ncbi:hypothetical protein [Propionibacterium sp.]|uniref:hypothetical protein n=1 Tax=Propionibacterium sp. TaxID=1977903 RepID=UPI0039E9B04E
MAEIRKHAPRSSAIGDQVRAAIGGVQHANPPVQNQSDQNRNASEDPFFAEGHPGSAGAAPLTSGIAAAGALGGFTLHASDRQGLLSLDADQIRQVSAVVREQPDGDDTEDELGE